MTRHRILLALFYRENRKWRAYLDTQHENERKFGLGIQLSCKSEQRKPWLKHCLLSRESEENKRLCLRAYSSLVDATFRPIALFRVNFSYLHYNKIQREYEPILGRSYKIARKKTTSAATTTTITSTTTVKRAI